MPAAPERWRKHRFLKMSPTRKFTTYAWAIYVKFKWYFKIKGEETPGLQDCVSVFKRKQKTKKEIFVGYLLYARHLLDTFHTSFHFILTSNLQKSPHSHIAKTHQFQSWLCCPGCDSGCVWSGTEVKCPWYWWSDKIMRLRCLMDYPRDQWVF